MGRATIPCIYCGSVLKPAPDHVPPKAVFLRPRPSNLITVPSCEDCNRSFSQDDEYLRVAMVVRREVAQHPASTPLIDSLARSVARPEARGFAQLISDSINDIELQTQAGIVLGIHPAFSVDLERLHRSVTRIGRALYFHETGVVVPPSVRVVADLRYESDRIRQKQVEGYLVGRPLRQFGRNEFQYQWVAASDNPLSSVCRMVFFGVTPFVCLTAPERPTPLTSAV